MDKNSISERIKSVRESAGVKQEAFALAIGVTNVTISRYEKGHRTPDADFLNQLVKIYGCNPGWLLTGNGEMRNAQPVVSADPAPLYLAEISPEQKKKAKLRNMLDRIIDEGDHKKIKAVESQLDLLDPGVKKPSHSHEDDGSGRNQDRCVA